MLDKLISINKERGFKIIRLFGIKISIPTRERENYLRFSKEIGEVDYEIVHILHATVFAINLVKFLNTFVNHKKHLFIFKSGPDIYKTLVDADNIIEGNLASLKINMLKTKKIIVHSLLTMNDIDYFYNNPQLLKITYWSIWGGDLYDFDNDHRSNFVKSNIKSIITIFDEPEYIKQYGYGKKCFQIIYPDNLLKSTELKKVKSKDKCINILVNHCADPSTIAILDKLKKYINEDIKITTILSYATVNKVWCKKDILKFLNKEFKNKFYVQKEWLPTEKYYELLKDQDIIILGMKRQQGIANLRYCATCGAKLFLSDNNPIYNQLEDLGLKINSIEKIENMTFDEFILQNEEDRVINRNIFLKRADKDHIKSLWNKIFEDEN